MRFFIQSVVVAILFMMSSGCESAGRTRSEIKRAELPSEVILQGGHNPLVPTVKLLGVDRGNIFRLGEYFVAPFEYELVEGNEVFAKDILLAGVGTKVVSTIPDSIAGTQPCGIFNSDGQCIDVISGVAWTFYRLNNAKETQFGLITISEMTKNYYSIRVADAITNVEVHQQYFDCDELFAGAVIKVLRTEGGEQLAVYALQHNGEMIYLNRIPVSDE